MKTLFCLKIKEELKKDMKFLKEEGKESNNKNVNVQEYLQGRIDALNTCLDILRDSKR